MDADGKSVARVVIEGDIEYAPHALNFVLHDRKYNQWYHCRAPRRLFRGCCVPCAPEPEPEPEASFDADGRADGRSSVAEKAAAAKVEDAEPRWRADPSARAAACFRA